MRILITDRHTSGDENIEHNAVGPDIELEFFDHHDDVTDEAWARADGIVTYRGTAAVMGALPKIQKATIVVRGGVGSGRYVARAQSLFRALWPGD